MRANRICRLIGHKPDRWASLYWDRWRCGRCGESFSRDWTLAESLWGRYWTARIWLGSLAWRVRDFLRCSMCGRRFGRHRKDCAPF